MSALIFTPATKTQSKLRLAILGPTGGGKTFTALAITKGRRIAVIDSEHGSASKYADRFSFDCLNIPDHDPRTYIAAIHAAEAAGYDVVIIDSLTHAWKATQELVDQETMRSRSANSFQSWGKVTPIWQALLQAIVGSRIHVIATIRSKIEWVIEENDRGKKVPRKVGTKPECRDGAEYEFDVVMEIDSEHNAWTTKTRCPDLDGKTWKCPSAADFGATIFGWLEAGGPAPAPVAAAAPAPVSPPTPPAAPPAAPPAPVRIPALDAAVKHVEAYGKRVALLLWWGLPAEERLAAYKRLAAGIDKVESVIGQEVHTYLSEVLDRHAVPRVADMGKGSKSNPTAAQVAAVLAEIDGPANTKTGGPS